MRWFVVFCLAFCVTSLILSQELTPEVTPSGVTIHVVRRGESLYTIAQQYEVSLETLISLNALENPNRLAVGQRLLVPAPDSVLAPILPTVTPIFHTVSSGETLFRIALKYEVSLESLAQANNIPNSSLIYVGQQLIIPVTHLSHTTPNLPDFIQSLTVLPQVFVEGKTGSIELTTKESMSVSASFLNRQQNVISLNNGTRHILLIGIPIFTQPNTYNLDISFNSEANTSSFSLPIIVTAGDYTTTNINVSPDQQALLDPSVEQFEISTLEALMSQFSSERLYMGSLGIPAASPMNAPFGTRRSYNGGDVSRYHNGADFASAPGTPVYASANGRIVLADKLNIRGNTVVIEHGWGVYTLYAHLSTITVTLGSPVTVGQVIGTAGSTGRVTGPHLHWEVWVNGVPVDPIQWTQTIFPQ